MGLMKKLKLPKVGGGPKGQPNVNQRVVPKSKTKNPSKRITRPVPIGRKYGTISGGARRR
tara:strand:- start:702 stop:881 length:180 start_codon:yes stop_codon:yes gene_type:complete